MDKFTFTSDEHGTFTADAERVTELVNFWNFRCNARPLDFALVQADVVKWLGYPSFESLSDVCNRFAFAIMMVNNDCEQQYMADKTQEVENAKRPLTKSVHHGL